MSIASRLLTTSALVILVSTTLGAGPGPFAQFELPDAWEARFWDDPDTKALLKLDPKSLAALVPVQSGLRFCRCPNCDADEAADPLIWSATKPSSLTCSRCGQTFPNAKFPAKKDGKIPEEVVEVLPGKTHHYPYYEVPAETQLYADERLYLDAKRDYEKREALSKAALYAAVRFHERRAASGPKDAELARFAAVIILRFAQVYPAYATHFDQPGQPKFLQRGDLGPPYRRGYRTGKWEWTASLDVPLNLVTAYALIRDDPTWAEVGRLLDDPNPKRTVENGFFRASAAFVGRQPEEYDEMSLQAYRGLFAVGRLLNDQAILADAHGRLALFAERGFYHDGYWRQGNAAAHQRVVRQLDGWIDRLTRGEPDNAAAVGLGGRAALMMGLIRNAAGVTLENPSSPEILQASWPTADSPAIARRAALLGGVGIARLSVGGEVDGLDIELRGMGNLGSPHFQRQALRLSVGGRTVLDDLDDQPSSRDGWDLATASHNTVVVDGLNQRETPLDAREPAEGGEFLYFAADPDFQVVALDDPRAYPRSTTRYRQIVVAASGKTSRYAVSVFQVHGGLQHDQIFHGPAGPSAKWKTSTPLNASSATLLPRSIPYIPETHAEDGRWFVQALGEFRRISEGRSIEPMTARLDMPGRPGVRLHVLGDRPLTIYSALTPDPTHSSPAATAAESGEGRASLVLRHRSADGSTLKSTFVNVFDPTGAGPSLKRVGRVASSPDTVVLFIETADGVEHLIINLRPGTDQTVLLADGRSLTTDGLVVRVGPGGLQLAGGTHSRYEGADLRLARTTGIVHGVGRLVGEGTRGWFEVDGYVDRLGSLKGRTLLIRHGDGPIHGWTIQAVEALGRGRAKIFVREEPGFLIDPTSSVARYYQFPRSVLSGPHQFTICVMGRTEGLER